ncbi:uncharacterized protein N7482_010576 [Penicillium canariense]|uniref:NACHT domain-containing protein n=1 Tax=Penicillium canariense TaxID=189055 RepID=A0A9W9HLT4_9EURO|nr:uncharacterized protein N7482_010576 [Penicillium canariense]KAJ5151324.1 hypothetical protein N7482_010576 [Penicillium canariense]
MSFGFGLGDFLAVLQLANDLRGRFAQAPREYKAITEEVESLILVLNRITDLDEEEVDEQRDDVNQVIRSCDNVLRDLDSRLRKFHILAKDSSPEWTGRVRQAWKRIRWDQAEIDNFRSRIVANISLLNLIVGKANQHGIQSLNDRQDDHERDKILGWLSPVSPSLRQSEVFNSHQKGTGIWLLETEDFQQWIRGEKQVLFCPGIPGSGKTVLSSIIIDHLEQRFPNPDGVVIAYLFCDYRQQHTLFELYSALLRQAVQRKTSIPESVKSFYQKYSTQSTRPSEDEIIGQLRSVLASCARAFVVIDALDECPIADGNHTIRNSFLRQLVRLQKEEGFHLLATSRPDQEIAAHFEGSASVEIRASSEDIQYYVDVRLNDLPSFVRKREKLKQAIKDSITKAAKEMYEFICCSSDVVLICLRFLLARLYFNLLLDESNEKGIRRMLEEFRTASESNASDHAYNETVSRIERQGANAFGLAKKTIGWIVNAKRALTIAELEHALAIEFETTEFDETNITDAEQLTSYCCGLVLVDEQTTEVKFVHYTTQKYFERTLKTWFPEIFSHITDSCLTYLCYDVFEEDRFEAKEEVENIPAEYPFYTYASLNWGHHFREAPGNRSILLNFLQTETKLIGYDRCGFEPLDWRPDPKTSNIKAEHIAAYFNLQLLMQKLLETNPTNVNIQDSRKQTPLFVATCHGHESMVKLLLNMGATVDLPDTDGLSPLHVAARKGYVRIAQILLDEGADIEMRYSGYQTPLCIAASNGHESVTTLLLDRGANYNPRDGDRSALHEASTSGHVTIIRELLSRGADIESKTGVGDVPLHDAALNGHLEVVKLFLEKGVSPDIANNEGETPLLRITEYFSYELVNQETHNATFELLLSKGANTEPKTKHGETVLHRTAQQGWEVPVKLLVDYGAKIEARNNDNMTPLRLAAERNRVEIVRLLLDRGARADTMSRSRQTPLHIAARDGNKTIAMMILDKAAKLDVFDLMGHTPLFMSTWRGHETVSRLLLNKGANPSPPGSGPQQLPSAIVEGGHQVAVRTLFEEDSNPDEFNVYRRTALHMASASGNTSIARLLLSAGAEPGTTDRYGRTPLFYAVCGGHLDMVQLLLDLPKIDRCRPDIWGLTPAVEAEKRELHKIKRLLDSKAPKLNPGGESSAESSVDSPSLEPKSHRFCDVCLGRLSDEETYYSCEYFNICRFCPPVQTNSCPVCGNQLVKRTNTPPTPTLAEICVCM